MSCRVEDDGCDRLQVMVGQLYAGRRLEVKCGVALKCLVWCGADLHPPARLVGSHGKLDMETGEN